MESTTDRTRGGLTGQLAAWLEAGGGRVGEVAIENRSGRLRLTHVDDRGQADGELEQFSTAADARKIIVYDESGAYRPLKSAPGLKRGWVLLLQSVAELREALDYFYPAAVGTWFAHLGEGVEAVALRTVLERQTGMYRFAKLISPAGAQELVGEACGSQGGCLKRVCWPIGDDEPVTSLPPGELSREPADQGEMPLLCVEACNWLVAKARKISSAEAKAREAGQT